MNKINLKFIVIQNKQCIPFNLIVGCKNREVQKLVVLMMMMMMMMMMMIMMIVLAVRLTDDYCQRFLPEISGMPEARHEPAQGLKVEPSPSKKVSFT